MGIEDATSNYGALQETVAGPVQSAEDQQAFEDILVEYREAFLKEANGNEEEANRRLTKWIADQLPDDLKKNIIEERHRQQDELHNRLAGEHHALLNEHEDSGEQRVA